MPPARRFVEIPPDSLCHLFSCCVPESGEGDSTEVVLAEGYDVPMFVSMVSLLVSTMVRRYCHTAGKKPTTVAYDLQLQISRAVMSRLSDLDLNE